MERLGYFALLLGFTAEMGLAFWAYLLLDSFERGAQGAKERDETLSLLMTGSFVTKGIEFIAFVCLLAAPANRWGFLPAIGFYLCLGFVHGRIRFAVERRLREIPATQSEAFWRGARVVFGMVLLFSVYYLVHRFAFEAFSKLIAVTVGPDSLKSGAIWVVFPASVLCGLGSVYLLSPVLVRVMFNAKRLEDPRLIGILEGCFRKAGLRIPSFWVLDMDRQKMHNAMVAGFALGRGPVRPALFFTRSLADELTPAEFESVILHEVSHIALRHVTRRLLWSVVALLVAFFVTSLFLAAFSAFLPKEWLSVSALLGVALSLLVQLSVLRWQVRKQELEADANAVFNLGADPSAFQGALAKITKMNDQSPSEKDPSSFFNPSAAHPTCQERIVAIEEGLRLRKAGPVAMAGSSPPFRPFSFIAIGTLALLALGLWFRGRTESRSPTVVPDRTVAGSPSEPVEK